MEIQSRLKKYQVNFLVELKKIKEIAQQDNTFWVIDKNVFDLYSDSFPVFPANRLFLLNAIEQQKNMNTALAICEKMTIMPQKRNVHLVSIGGGIVQDITGFVASCLYRGIRWTFFPTTLLASCDSCIGGKSSLNYKGFKNLLGSFYPPDDIWIYSPFFRTLTERDYCSGLGEVVKFNVIAGEKAFTRMEIDMEDILNHDYLKLQKYVANSLQFKRKFIEEDEFDRGVRILLNFAHTFGHSYEVSSNYEIPHGSAVALGMLTANYISFKRGLLSKELLRRVETVCKKILRIISWKDEIFTFGKLMIAIHKDKKQTGENITAILLDEKKGLSICCDVQEAEILEAVDYTKKIVLRN